MNQTAHRDQVETEARAKIIWGDDPDTVLNYLRVNGFSDDEALAIVQEVVRERLATVRGIGFKKIMIGTGLVAIPVAAWFMMMSAGVISVKLLGIAGTIGLWGLWKILQGSLMAMFPSAEHGDIADQSD